MTKPEPDDAPENEEIVDALTDAPQAAAMRPVDERRDGDDESSPAGSPRAET